uniref:Uncharacterized protein n=1 Tax=Aegilops tauschii subsp. strangulata TaxID=200361 RepID=A0A452YBB2_AEGTS
MARMYTVGQELADEVQSKYGFCMSNVNNDFNQTFNFTSDPSFISDCNEQTQGTNNIQASRSATFLVVVCLSLKEYNTSLLLARSTVWSKFSLVFILQKSCPLLHKNNEVRSST